MHLSDPARHRRVHFRLPLRFALLAAYIVMWPGAAFADPVQVVIDHYFAHVGDPRADYFHGALLTEHDLDDEQSYKHSSNRYIGETEENLNELFLSAGFANVVLLFDEGDALLGNRTDVEDGHDRYAGDFIVLDPQEGTWRGRLFLDLGENFAAGVYDELSGTFEDLVVVPEPAPLAAMLLALLAFASMSGRFGLRRAAPPRSRDIPQSGRWAKASAGTTSIVPPGRCQ